MLFCSLRQALRDKVCPLIQDKKYTEMTDRKKISHMYSYLVSNADTDDFPCYVCREISSELLGSKIGVIFNSSKCVLAELDESYMTKEYTSFILDLIHKMLYKV